MYGIRLRTRNWEVSLKRKGVQLSKSFGFATHGGKAAALRHAQVWRDEMVKEHPPVKRAQRANKIRRNNTTGIPGVTRRLGPNGEPQSWHATTYISPTLKLTKCFGVRRYGAEAKLLAIAERQKQLEQMVGLARIHPAEAVVRAAPPKPLPADLPRRIARGEVVRCHNTSGRPGVYYVQRYGGQSGYWAATTAPVGAPRITKCFSVKDHGEEGAKALAIAARQKQLAQVHGERPSKTRRTPHLTASPSDTSPRPSAHSPRAS